MSFFNTTKAGNGTFIANGGKVAGTGGVIDMTNSSSRREWHLLCQWRIVETIRADDPLASHIFVSRRHYRNAHDTKGGKRREMHARLSFNTACELGFRGSLDEWERLMGAVARR